jgi:CPA1 family monovalent cation:H+ antiporter
MLSYSLPACKFGGHPECATCADPERIGGKVSVELYTVISILITLSALFGYVNHRFIRLPTTIGIMLISIVMSLGMVTLGRLGHTGFHIEREWIALIKNIDFNEVLMVGMLGFLLFAGSMHVDLNELKKEKWEIAIFSTVGVLLSTLIVGALTYLLSSSLDLGIRLIDCLLFGALISPTDPIAVLGILKKAGTPKSLEIKITGESLFNDGIGVVVFVVLLGIARGTEILSFSTITLFFLEEAAGGILLGLVLGWIAYILLKSIDNYQVEILITLALVTGGYALASELHTSGPIAMVVSGLLIGNRGRAFAMSEKTRQNLTTFWELIDDILNAVLFVLIGIELLVVTISARALAAGVVAIPVVLLSRLVSIGMPLCFLKAGKKFDYESLKVMTWGGLRGGISVALALSLPLGVAREVVITMTYTVVVFSIIVQGMTVKHLVKRPILPSKR